MNNLRPAPQIARLSLLRRRRSPDSLAYHGHHHCGSNRLHHHCVAALPIKPSWPPAASLTLRTLGRFDSISNKNEWESNNNHEIAKRRRDLVVEASRRNFGSSTYSRNYHVLRKTTCASSSPHLKAGYMMMPQNLLFGEQKSAFSVLAKSDQCSITLNQKSNDRSKRQLFFGINQLPIPMNNVSCNTISPVAAIFSTGKFYSQSAFLLSNDKKFNGKENAILSPKSSVPSIDALTTTSSVVNISSTNNNCEPTSSKNHTQQTSIKATNDQNPTTEISKTAISHLPESLTYLPRSLHPYARLARLDKPIGTYLLLHPCLWSTALATNPLGSTPIPDLHLCALFATGAFLMRGAGCTINDMWDSNFDKNVERTKDRPLASGELTYPQAWKFLALQMTGGLGVLLSLPNLEPCFLWGVASLPLVATYPLMKRYTNYPQLVLGMTFNWGAIMGWVAVRGCVDWSVVGPLYASGVAWTLVYDTLYAHQDKRDDKKLGLKSTALTFGEEGTKPILTALTGVTWGGWMLAGYNAGYGMPLDNPFFYGGCSMAAMHLLWQITSADLNDSDNLAYRFRSNNVVGAMVFGSCVAGNFMAG